MSVIDHIQDELYKCYHRHASRPVVYLGRSQIRELTASINMVPGHCEYNSIHGCKIIIVDAEDWIHIANKED